QDDTSAVAPVPEGAKERWRSLQCATWQSRPTREMCEATLAPIVRRCSPQVVVVCAFLLWRERGRGRRSDSPAETQDRAKRSNPRKVPAGRRVYICWAEVVAGRFQASGEAR